MDTSIADRVEIEALRGACTDAVMTRDYDRFAALFTADGAWRMPHVPIEIVGRAALREGVERLQGFWEFFVQTVHPGVIELAGDTATGRAYVAEFGRLRDGSSHSNYAIYHDRYVRTPDGWRFQERVYEVRYADAGPLTGEPGTAAVRVPAGVIAADTLLAAGRLARDAENHD
nr:nuclear transport factor 2 family protein [uncultured Actinoplanes sp.]